MLNIGKKTISFGNEISDDYSGRRPRDGKDSIVEHLGNGVTRKTFKPQSVQKFEKELTVLEHLKAENFPHAPRVISTGIDSENRPYIDMTTAPGREMYYYYPTISPEKKEITKQLAEQVAYDLARTRVYNHDINSGGIFIEEDADGLPQRVTIIDFADAKIEPKAWLPCFEEQKARKRFEKSVDVLRDWTTDFD